MIELFEQAGRERQLGLIVVYLLVWLSDRDHLEGTVMVPRPASAH